MLSSSGQCTIQYCRGLTSVLIILKDKDSLRLFVNSSECNIGMLKCTIHVGGFIAVWEDHFKPSTCPHATLITWSPLNVACDNGDGKYNASRKTYRFCIFKARQVVPLVAGLSLEASLSKTTFTMLLQCLSDGIYVISVEIQ